MRARGFILFSLIAAVWAVRADEKLPVLKAGSEVYSNVTVTTVTATDIYFTYSDGMANVKLSKLDPALQEHFHYNPVKAGEVEQKQAAANTQYRIQAINQPAPRPPADESVAQPASAAQTSELSGKESSLPSETKPSSAQASTDWGRLSMQYGRDIDVKNGFIQPRVFAVRWARNF